MVAGCVKVVCHVVHERPIRKVVASHGAVSSPIGIVHIIILVDAIETRADIIRHHKSLVPRIVHIQSCLYNGCAR